VNTVNPDKRGRLLIVDDDAATLKQLVRELKKEGYEVVGRQSGSGGMNVLEKVRFDVVLTELHMEKVGGMAFLRRCRELSPATEVVVITGCATISSAVDAMKEGAFHYIAKPFRIDEVRQVVKDAMKMARLKRENQVLRQRVEDYRGRVNIITQDPGMQQVLETAQQIAPSGCNVLITGESGTGKELLARYVHAHSAQAEGPFVAVNCGAFQEDLLANELFGHEKGAFTGAGEMKRGLIEAAHGGTLFLDEIGEMPLNMQVKLLRAVQEKEVLRLGGTKPVKVGVRYIAATNRDLEEAVTARRFRRDLYYRLNVVRLRLPALSERRDDIPLLAHYFLKKHTTLMDRSVADIAADAMAVLIGYDYPGNVRELENMIERGVALAEGDAVEKRHLPRNLRELDIRVFRTPGESLPTLEEREADYVRWVLDKTQGNRTKAAQILGIDRVSLWRKIKRYGLAAS
jgi:DNA-binding NtrC family response regulator